MSIISYSMMKKHDFSSLKSPFYSETIFQIFAFIANVRYLHLQLARHYTHHACPTRVPRLSIK